MLVRDSIRPRFFVPSFTAHRAGRAGRVDWGLTSIVPRTTGLSRELRDALASHWRAAAALEHASIASFARFSLELLALGAPPDLLAAAQSATADEIAHARTAYALASAFAGRPIGPSPLDVSGAAPSTSTAGIVTALVEEACVGETLGAAEARSLAGFVDCPALIAAYEQIADDETRHAELGWSTLAWLLRDASEELHLVAGTAFDTAVAKMRADPRLPPSVIAPRHGLLSPSMLGLLRRRALAEVVIPCARALLPGRESLS